MRVIIVDDENVIRLGLQKIMSGMDLGIDIIGSYSNGLDALNQLMKVGEQGVDVLITDIKMPVMDGFKLVESVREMNKKLAIIVISGFSQFEYARKAIRNGVSDYLLKPIDKYQLYETLNRIRQELFAVQQETEDPAHAHDHYVVGEIKSILEHEYDKYLDLDEIAARVGMSANYLSRLFKRKTNLRITDYLIQVRIDKAKQFLSDHPNLKNYQVAQLVGYTDAVYFNKLFKKMVGATPKEFKNF